MRMVYRRSPQFGAGVLGVPPSFFVFCFTLRIPGSTLGNPYTVVSGNQSYYSLPGADVVDC